MLTNLMDAIRAGYNSNGKCQSFLLKMTGGDARDILNEFDEVEKELADLRAAQRPDSARQVEFARGVIDEQYERIADLERDNETLRRGRDHAIKSTQDMMTVIRQRDREIADLKTKLTTANQSIADKVSLLEHTLNEKSDAQREVFRLRGEVSLWKAKAEAKHDPMTPALLQLVDKQKQEIKALEREVRGLQMQVVHKDEVIEAVTKANDELSAKVQEFSKTIVDLNDSNRRLSQRLLETNSRDNERIRELQARIERARTGDNTSIHQLRFEVRRLTEVEIGLRRKLQKKDKIIEGLQKGLNAKTETIRNLNAKLGQIMEQTRFGLID